MKIKRCGKCKISKSLEEFHRETGRVDGLANRCKLCALGESRQVHIKRKADPEKWQHYLSRTAHWRANNIRSVMFYNARNRARKRKLEFNIEINDIIIPDVCPILGIPLTVGLGKKGARDNYNAPSLDRINNSQGYIKGNIIVVSMRANALKSNASFQEIQKLATWWRGLSVQYTT